MRRVWRVARSTLNQISSANAIALSRIVFAIPRTCARARARAHTRADARARASTSVEKRNVEKYVASSVRRSASFWFSSALQFNPVLKSRGIFASLYLVSPSPRLASLRAATFSFDISRIGVHLVSRRARMPSAIRQIRSNHFPVPRRAPGGSLPQTSRINLDQAYLIYSSRRQIFRRRSRNISLE